MSGLGVISKKLIFCIKPTKQQATVGVLYLVSMSICCAIQQKFDYSAVLDYIQHL